MLELWRRGIDIRAKICVKCGVEQAPLVEEVSNAWYLVPFFFMIIGGVIAWFVNKDRDPKKAQNFLIFGFLWSAVVSIIYVLFVAATIVPRIAALFTFFLLLLALFLGLQICLHFVSQPEENI